MQRGRNGRAGSRRRDRAPCRSRPAFTLSFALSMRKNVFDKLRYGRMHLMKLLLGLWVALWICGCSQQPTKLANQIASADRLVATNSGTGAVLSVSGEELKKIVHALGSAKRDRHSYAAIFDWHIQFYSRTNFVTAIRLQDRVFRTDSAQYSDETGVLKAFYEGPLRDASARRLSQ